MSDNNHRESTPETDQGNEKPELQLGEIMDYYSEELRVLREERKRAIVEAEVAMKLTRR